MPKRHWKKTDPTKPRRHRGDRRNREAINGIFGFVKLVRRRGGDHVTLWVEGKDGNEPSVSAIAMNREQFDALIKRCTNVRSLWESREEIDARRAAKVTR